MKSKFEQTNVSLGLAETIASSSSVPLNEYTFESMALLRQVGKQMGDNIAKDRCADYKTRGKPTEGCEDIRVSIVEVSFDELPEEKDRKYLKQLPTSFRLTPEAIEKLRWAAKEVLSNSQDFDDFLNGLNGKTAE